MGRSAGRIAGPVGAVALWLGAAMPVHAHEFWINQERYRSPSAGGFFSGLRCCGERDCFVAEDGVDFVARGDVWLFLEGPAARAILEAWSFNIVGKTWPRAPDQTYRSEDTHSWVCVGRVGIRCFFYDYGGY